VRPARGEPVALRHATALVVTVTDAIRRQYLAAGLVDPDRVAALPGGADTERYHPGRAMPRSIVRWAAARTACLWA